jgi:hypothetical protein
MVLADGAGTPLGLYPEKTSPAEVKLLEPMVKQVRGRGGRRKCGKPQRLIGDWGYDSNPVCALLVTRGIEPIIPPVPTTRSQRIKTGAGGRAPSAGELSSAATPGCRTFATWLCDMKDRRRFLLRSFIWPVPLSP